MTRITGFPIDTKVRVSCPATYFNRVGEVVLSTRDKITILVPVSEEELLDYKDCPFEVLYSDDGGSCGRVLALPVHLATCSVQPNKLRIKEQRVSPTNRLDIPEFTVEVLC